MQTIVNELELPAPERQGRRLNYVRSKCDPTVLIAGSSGDCFTRKDGAKWEWPGCMVELNSRSKPECEPTTALEDTVCYRPDGVTETVEHLLPEKKQAVA